MKNLLSKIKTFAEDNPHFIFSLLAFVLTITVLVFCFSLPSSAADEPSEGGQSVVPTDLTGFSCTLPTGWTVSSGLGKFLVDYSIVLSTGESYSCNFIYLGYKAPTNSEPNYLCYGAKASHPDGPFTKVVSSSTAITYTFTFTGGEDSTNPTLINWLFNNGIFSPPEPEPTPTYTIQPNYYQIKLQPDMIPDYVGFYEYGGQFIYEGETYRSLRFARVSSLLTNVYLYDDDGNQVVIKGQIASNDGWFSGRNITLVTPITTENAEAYTYFTENLSATEQSPFDLVTYMISGFFKALDNFYLFFDFTLLDFIFVMCGLLGAIWFLKLLAGG